MLAVLTNEHPTEINQIMLMYLKNIAIDSTIAPSFQSSSAFTYYIGITGLYFVKGVMDDP